MISIYSFELFLFMKSVNLLYFFDTTMLWNENSSLERVQKYHGLGPVMVSPSHWSRSYGRSDIRSLGRTVAGWIVRSLFRTVARMYAVHCTVVRSLGRTSLGCTPYIVRSLGQSVKLKIFMVQFFQFHSSSIIDQIMLSEKNLINNQ